MTWTTDEDPIVQPGCPADAVAALGGVIATARALGVTRQIVHRWKVAGMSGARTKHVLRLAALSGVPAWRLAGMDADPAG